MTSRLRCHLWCPGQTQPLITHGAGVQVLREGHSEVLVPRTAYLLNVRTKKHEQRTP